MASMVDSSVQPDIVRRQFEALLAECHGRQISGVYDLLDAVGQRSIRQSQTEGKGDAVHFGDFGRMKFEWDSLVMANPALAKDLSSGQIKLVRFAQRVAGASADPSDYAREAFFSTSTDAAFKQFPVWVAFADGDENCTTNDAGGGEGGDAQGNTVGGGDTGGTRSTTDQGGVFPSSEDHVIISVVALKALTRTAEHNNGYNEGATVNAKKFAELADLVDLSVGKKDPNDYTKEMMAVLGITITSCGGIYISHPVLEKVLGGPKIAHVAYTILWVLMLILGFGLLVNVAFDKAARTKIFGKYALLLAMTILVSLITWFGISVLIAA